ncbi:acetoin dehydrogenase dihydrolipoyllysine-residue acetyltransferase subunit [Aureimonas jatrophae]|uniref:Pyruvate dehydrogenase E2 component (Dihydrolipoamide acetyltransferase) n=1 Tax=Aureimonas jatrophae TaxID=1166073 RepID=A0A1H0L9M0_9HYPH|nr:acetoin dehydrogenase dihydrolipoyllysine-residue acetyltransferase subunit [Aureimonas jatrophae]MBB3952468.1 pyruvate dehydrogenase E2 component (dihydrolipoamide acetyltransferase) [Aureimonas jatrophae]SDO64907.1 pyruvate dehydrogenase E2 component (dihydrolipoamide acetyltransferase) [Aureimonas jatrophae]
MPTEVILPKVDMDMATGQISRWFRKEGDQIRKGEPLFEIETDKAAMEVDAPASGTLRNVTGAEGVDIAVGAPVAWIYAEGERFEAAAPTADAGRPDVEVDSGSVTPNDAAMLAGRAEDILQETPVVAGGERRGVRATPLARRLAREAGLDLSTLTGRGPCGRIGREEVEEAVASARRGAAAPKPEAAAKPALAAALPAPASVPAGLAEQPSTASAPRTVPTDAPLHAAWLREGAGTPVILIHGFGSELASWRPMLAEIAEAMPVLGLDLPGHGGSVDRVASGFDDLVAAVEETIRAHGIASAHLVGHSLGGAVAAAVASGITLDARSLLLVAPGGFGPDIDTGFTDGFARATQEPAVRAWLHHLVADPAALSDGFVRATARARADGRQASAQTDLGHRLFSNGTQHFDVRRLVGELSIPVKIVVGAEDRVVSARHFAGLPGRIALHIFARTGHMPQIEQRAEVARLLRELVR